MHLLRRAHRGSAPGTQPHQEHAPRVPRRRRRRPSGSRAAQQLRVRCRARARGERLPPHGDGRIRNGRLQGQQGHAPRGAGRAALRAAAAGQAGGRRCRRQARRDPAGDVGGVGGCVRRYHRARAQHCRQGPRGDGAHQGRDTHELRPDLHPRARLPPGRGALGLPGGAGGGGGHWDCGLPHQSECARKAHYRGGEGAGAVGRARPRGAPEVRAQHVQGDAGIRCLLWALSRRLPPAPAMRLLDARAGRGRGDGIAALVVRADGLHKVARAHQDLVRAARRAGVRAARAPGAAHRRAGAREGRDLRAHRRLLRRLLRRRLPPGRVRVGEGGVCCFSSGCCALGLRWRVLCVVRCVSRFIVVRWFSFGGVRFWRFCAPMGPLLVLSAGRLLFLCSGRCSASLLFSRARVALPLCHFVAVYLRYLPVPAPFGAAFLRFIQILLLCLL
mmetsp:Transcript_53391/g.130467  ORF Transcript_53391/g.130467 Transcript_53391/m.130467 type:complete len:445 (+) Transcript_53391:452-1786(+)